MKRAFLVGTATLGLLAAGGFYVFSLITSDHLEFQEGGPAYWLLVTSETLTGWPSQAPVRFRYSARDGTAPERIVMTYQSEDSPEDLVRKYRDHCKARQFAEVAEVEFLQPSSLACDADDYRIEIAFQADSGGTVVGVTFLGSAY